MIQSILFFALGFLCAGFLVLAIAPTIWRRAVMLTRKRIEASAPLSRSEIQADKDRMRAEFAMSTRRLEMSVKSLRDKTAAQAIEIDRSSEELRRMAARLAERDEASSQIEGRSGELHNELRLSEDQIRHLTDRLAEVERLLEARALELDKLGRMYDEAALTSSNRQIELVARETEIEKLAVDVSLMRRQRKENERRMQEAAAATKTAHEALKAERKKVDELEKKVERLMTTLAKREEKLDRREGELAQLHERAKAGNDSGPEAEAARPAGLLLSDPPAGVRSEDIDSTIAKLKEDRDRLESRLTTLTRENRKLRTAANAAQKSEDRIEERRENALLREQISDLAAEMIGMTAALEGADSPIRKALATPPPDAPPGPRDRIASLADRVTALQKATSTN